MLPIVTYSYHLCWIFETNNQYPKWPCRLWHMNREASNIARFKESVPMVPSGVATWPKGSWPKRVWRFSKAGERETVPRLSKLSPGYLHMFRAIVTIQDSSWLSTAAGLVCRQQQLGVDLNLWEIAMGSAAELRPGLGPPSMKWVNILRLPL